ncbi:UNVERIFIED_CONTAM: DeSI-like protein [Sesamum radiatum]|uniref:DeSI-like protein n=1 Tax=Sesamum radiatum TaxID=300843 RepID=A0AAW2WIM0_SESRA
MLCLKSSIEKGRGSVPVHLNVYDLTSMNGYAYWFGLGVYHSGVQVHGVEYAFGAHEHPTTGIFEGEPKQCDGFTFRKSILIGWTDMTPGEVRGMMEELAEKYRGDAYNLITKNCNHFCDDACIKLTGNPIPSWVNRLARIVVFEWIRFAIAIAIAVASSVLFHIYSHEYKIFPYIRLMTSCLYTWIALPLHNPSEFKCKKLGTTRLKKRHVQQWRRRSSGAARAGTPLTRPPVHLRPLRVLLR